MIKLVLQQHAFETIDIERKREGIETEKTPPVLAKILRQLI